MNGIIQAIARLIPARLGALRVALAGALLICAGQMTVADDSPNPSKPATGKSSAKPGSAKPTAKAAAKPGGAQPRSSAGDLPNDGAPSELDNQLLDGLPPVKRPTAKQPAAGSPPDRSAPPAADADRPPVSEGPVLSHGGTDPLHQIGEQMRAIERRLEAARSGDAETGELQAEIVDELARLIEKLEQQQQGQQSAASGKQSPSSASERKKVKQPGTPAGNTAAADKRPVKESTERLGKADVHAPDAADVRGLMKDVWGQLPARQREQMLQSPPEQFLPKYELLLEKYYKRLADGQRHQP